MAQLMIKRLDDFSQFTKFYWKTFLFGFSHGLLKSHILKTLLADWQILLTIHWLESLYADVDTSLQIGSLDELWALMSYAGPAQE